MERPVDWHGHEFSEICIVLKGSALHFTAAGRSSLKEGDVLIMPPGGVHAFQHPRGLEVANIYFLSEWFLPELRLEEDAILSLFFGSSLSSASVPIREVRLAPGISGKILRELRDLDLTPAPISRWTSCCFFKILHLIFGAFTESDISAVALNYSPPVWRTLVEIDRIITAGETLDLRALAAQIGLSRDHLTRVFERQVGVTPTAFHQRRRAQFACRLLLSTRLPLAEVAQQLGYADEAHLSRLFRRAQGITPGSYRRKFASDSL